MTDNQLIFRSFASGSSGNCYYLGTQQWGILIDAGISARTIQKNLREMRLDYANIMGVLITHDHADYIRAVGTLESVFTYPSTPPAPFMTALIAIMVCVRNYAHRSVISKKV